MPPLLYAKYRKTPAAPASDKARSRKRIDVPAWMREETTFLFIVENKRRGQRLHLREDELIPFLKEIIKFKKSPLRRLFRNRYTKIL